jgi:TolB-like protein/cytochrome c-type biogenesis protein CcmH/NrfG
LCEFASVVDAVACAVAIQRGMAGRELDVPEAERIRFRIGVNLGDVIVEGEDIYGDGVNIAARLEGLAEPSGVCVSGKVREELRKRLELAFAPMGQQRVKNIAEPVEAWRVVLDGMPGARKAFRMPRQARAAAAVLVLLLLAVMGVGGWWWWQRTSEPASVAGPSLPDRPSVAVLPFEAPGGDAAQERLAEGLTEDLITELARSPALFVTAPNSAFAYKGKRIDERQVGRELGVRYVLEGSLERQGDRLRLAARLIDTATGEQLWAERYDRPADDLFAVRDELLGRIVGGLVGYDGPVWRAWAEQARRKPTESLTAWDYYLLARNPQRRMDREGTAEVRRLLEQAIALDPRFARAWSWLADTHFSDTLNGWSEDRARSWELFHEAARKAADLDPGDAHAQLELGMSHFARGRAELGAQAWDRAVALAPNDATIIRAVGGQLPIALGAERAVQGVELAERALLRLDPLHPPFQWISLGTPLYFAGRYAEAAAAFERIEKHWIETRLMLAVSYAQMGEKEKAAAQAAEVLKEEPGFTAEAWVDNDFYQPGSSSAALLIDGARKAGLPVCATAEVAAKFEPGNRRPECEAERAKAAAPKT